MSEFNDRLINPYHHERRLQDVEGEVRRLWRRITGTATGGGAGGAGSMGILNPGVPVNFQADAQNAPAVVEVNRITQSGTYSADGTYIPTLSIVLDANFTPPVGSIGYTVKVQPTGGTSYEVDGPNFSPDDGILYANLSPLTINRPSFGLCYIQVRLRTVAGAGAYGPSFPFTVSEDTTPPTTPSGLTVVGSRFGSFRIAWTKCPDADYKETWVFAGKVSGFTPDLVNFTNRRAVVSGTSAEVNWDGSAEGSGPFYSTSVYVVIVHVDRTGNVSPQSSEVNPTMRTVVGLDISSGAVDGTKLAATMNITSVMNLLTGSSLNAGKTVLDLNGLSVKADGSNQNVVFLDTNGVQVGAIYAAGSVAGADAAVLFNSSGANFNFDVVNLRLGSFGGSVDIAGPDIYMRGWVKSKVDGTVPLDVRARSTQTSHLTTWLATDSTVRTWIDKNARLQALDYIGTPQVQATAGELLLAMTGDAMGSTNLYIHNRTNENGLKLLQTPGTGGNNWVDIVMGWGGLGGGTSNLRLEGRVANTFLGTTKEFQFGALTNPDVVMSAAGLQVRHGKLDMQVDTYLNDKIVYLRGDTAHGLQYSSVNNGARLFGFSTVDIGVTSPGSYTLRASIDNSGLNVTGVYKTNGTQTLGARRTGWTAATGTATRTTFATSTVTLPLLAERVKALIDDLIAHGIIGA